MPVKHIALIEWKAETSPGPSQSLIDEIGALKNRIAGITEFISGLYSSPEAMNDGYTHGFIMTFTDAAARDAYLPHPEHERVKAKVLPHVKRVVVFDFEV